MNSYELLTLAKIDLIDSSISSSGSTFVIKISFSVFSNSIIYLLLDSKRYYDYFSFNY